MSHLVTKAMHNRILVTCTVGDGGGLGAAYVLVLTSCHAFLFDVADLSNINCDGGFKCDTKYILCSHRLAYGNNATSSR